jgi:Zn2+/Cd2+-exporting ATPase
MAVRAHDGGMAVVASAPAEGATGRSPDGGAVDHDLDAQALRRDATLTAMTGAGLAVGVTGTLLGAPPWLTGAAYLVAYLAGGLPAGIEALRSLRKGALDIDLLMVVAALAAAAVGEARDGAILLFLFSLAGVLEDYALGRTKRAVDALLQLRPDVALRRRPGGGVERVAVEALRPGDVVEVAPGERIPADGRLVEGRSAVDQAAITGESVPVDKSIDDDVFAATVNGYGAIAVVVTKPAGESTVARMIDLVTEARAQRSPSQHIGTWFGQRYTVIVLTGSGLALAVLLLAGRELGAALYTTATLLVAASPCAIVISVPAAILSALAAAARSGVLFKGGGALETLGKSVTLAFDKTGTLTFGRPSVTEIFATDGDAAGLLGLAATIEARSEHPIARAVLEEAKRRGVPIGAASDTAAIPGQGVRATLGTGSAWAGTRRLMTANGISLPAALAARVAALEARGATLVLVGDMTAVRGVIAVEDTVRPSAARALARLRASGVQRIVMLTGDHAGVALAVASRIGLAPTDVHADLLPEDKLMIVAGLAERGPIAYVGDGVNDAAALARADVGIAMGAAGSDVALETADVALLADDLGPLETAYRLSRRANRIVRQNLVFAIGAMVILVGLTLFGDLPLPLAVVGHEGGTLLVVANGLRLLVGERGPIRGHQLASRRTVRTRPLTPGR